MSAHFLTPTGVRCMKHGTHALADEPCWRCEVSQLARVRGMQTSANESDRSDEFVRVSDDTAFASPFGTIRQCSGCGCLVGGGPTRCVRCVKESDRSDSLATKLHEVIRSTSLRGLIACLRSRHNPAHEPARRPR